MDEFESWASTIRWMGWLKSGEKAWEVKDWKERVGK
jgi:hypothetical protein